MQDGGRRLPRRSRHLRPTSRRPRLVERTRGRTRATPGRRPGSAPARGRQLSLSVRDGSVRAKRFYAYRPHWHDGEVVEIVCAAAAARAGARSNRPRSASGDAPTMSRSGGTSTTTWPGSRPHTAWPDGRNVATSHAWADQLDLVLTLHGQHWTGFVFNTFDQMAAILERVCEEVPGDRVLAYLPGWEGRYYWQYPAYGPGDGPGGRRRVRPAGRDGQSPRGPPDADVRRQRRQRQPLPGLGAKRRSEAPPTSMSRSSTSRTGITIGRARMSRSSSTRESRVSNVTLSTR